MFLQDVNSNRLRIAPISRSESSAEGDRMRHPTAPRIACSLQSPIESGIFLNIAPKRAQREKFEDAEKCCYHVNVFSVFGNRQVSRHRRQARAARKIFEDAQKCCYHVNVFSVFQNGHFLNIAPSARSAEIIEDVETCFYDVNVFSAFEYGHASQHRHQARAAREKFNIYNPCFLWIP